MLKIRLRLMHSNEFVILCAVTKGQGIAGHAQSRKIRLRQAWMELTQKEHSIYAGKGAKLLA